MVKKIFMLSLVLLSSILLISCSNKKGYIINEVFYDENNNLIIKYDNDEELNLGKKDSIKNININKNGDLEIKYLSGSTETLELQHTSLEFNISDTHIQYKTKKTDWINLISISDITGKDGREIEFKVSETSIEWRYKGEEEYYELIPLDLLRGKDGSDGKDGKDGSDGKDGKDGVDGIDGKDGTNGKDGIDGIDGKETEFSSNETHLLWRYKGEKNWIELIPLTLLTGQKGEDGKSSYEIYKKYNPEYSRSEQDWIEDLVSGNLNKVTEYYTVGLSRFENILFFPEPSTIISVDIDTLGKSLPTAKNEGPINVITELVINGSMLKTYGTIQVQGSSTAYWPKKNFTLKFYEDIERTKLLKVKIGNSVAPNEWIVKAEWIDPSMLRNAVSFRLWEQMVESRTTIPKYEVDNAWFDYENMIEGMNRGGKGFPMPHPSHIKVNGEHYGIHNFQLGHDIDNFNIDPNNPKHVYMEFDARGGYTYEKTWEKFGSHGIGEWITGYHPHESTYSQEIIDSIENLGNFINGDQNDFNEMFDYYLDKNNIIDYMLFIEMIYDWDAISQDLEIVTYDLKKWYFLPWDKDTTFGMSWDQSGIISNSEENLLLNYNEKLNTEIIWNKSYEYLKTDIEKRYKELRFNQIFSANNIYNLTTYLNRLITKEIWEAENNKWINMDRPSINEINSTQMIKWFDERLNLLDSHFNYE